MTARASDGWHFVCDDTDNSWTWQRHSPSGEEVDRSLYTFHSFNVCVADAQRAGFHNHETALRRVRTSELEPSHRDSGSEGRPDGTRTAERRRRPRENQQGESE